MFSGAGACSGVVFVDLSEGRHDGSSQRREAPTRFTAAAQRFVSEPPHAVQRTRQRLGLKICKVPPSLNLILAPGDPSSGRRTNTLPPFRNRPGPQRQHAPRPPAAGGRLDLPDTAPLGNQVEAGAAICALMSTRRPEHTTSHVRIVAGKSGTQSRIRVPY